MKTTDCILLSGNEAIAQAAMDVGVQLGTGYPGTPSTEILERFSELGGRGQWAPNEKVATEVALGASFAGARTLVTMKHVGLNVAADPLFTAAYTGVTGAMVVVSADDPGMASSQNEQDNRHYAAAAGVPMLEPSDSQDAYDLLHEAIAVSERWRIPVILRTTTRICHSKSIVRRRQPSTDPPAIRFERDVKGRVMIPAYARPAHRRLREKLAEIATWAEGSHLVRRIEGNGSLGIVTSGVSFAHATEAAPQASFLKLSITYPLPLHAIAAFAREMDRCVVIEEGDPYLVDALRAGGITVEGKPPMYRFGELSVERVRRILASDQSPETPTPAGKPPRLCPGCPHGTVFEILGKLDCIVAGDIGCYTLGVLPPYNAIDSTVCMGASIGVGLGLRQVLPDDEARRVVSVVGDSTFIHSGITGLVEMVYNPPPTGHVVLILDNGTTAMTGLQEHPGTGRRLDHQPTGRVMVEDLATSLGIRRVHVVDPTKDPERLEALLKESLSSAETAVIVARRVCLLAAKKLRKLESKAQRDAE